MGMDTITVLLFFAFMIGCLLSKRKILKVLGSFLLLYVLLGMFLLLFSGSSDFSGPEATKIVNELRNLKSAATLFQIDQGRWLMPGEEASLDEYLDRPIVTVERKIFANVMLSEELRVADGDVHQYVGVELIPESRNDAEPIRVQKKLASRAKKDDLLQEVQSGDVTSYELYRSGLKVFMQVR